MTYKKGHSVSQKLRKYLSRIHKGKHYSHKTEFKKGHIPWSKGKKLPPLSTKAKEKISKSLIGNTHSLGCKYSEDVRNKMRNVHNTGRFPKGPEHPNWKGGVSALRDLIEATFEYKKWRTSIFQRDNYTCQQCGAKNGAGKSIYLEAHHNIKEFNQILKENNIKTVKKAQQCSELWDTNNGLTLCIQCHNPTKKGGLKCSLAKRK